jgi:hypothetical protein
MAPVCELMLGCQIRVINFTCHILITASAPHKQNGTVKNREKTHNERNTEVNKKKNLGWGKRVGIGDDNVQKEGPACKR